MAIETIKCRECGSADVTEFKSGSYVCAHCEAVFKHVNPAATSGGCEIDDCGVPAVGRCSMCNRRFCGTHQARGSAGLAYIDSCTKCQTESRKAWEQAQAAKEMRAAALMNIVISSTDPLEVMNAVLELPSVALAEPFPFMKTVGAAWEKHVISGVLGAEPTADLVTMRYEKSALSGRWREADRRSAWRHGRMLIDDAGWSWHEEEGASGVLAGGLFVAPRAGQRDTLVVECGCPITVRKKGGHLLFGSPNPTWTATTGVRVMEAGRQAALTTIKAFMNESPLCQDFQKANDLAIERLGTSAALG